MKFWTILAEENRPIVEKIATIAKGPGRPEQVLEFEVIRRLKARLAREVEAGPRAEVGSYLLGLQ